MGGASSKNISDLLTKIVANQSANVESDAVSTANQTIILNASTLKGDIDFDASIEQTAYVNTTALLDALTIQSSNIKMQEQIKQQAQSLVSGLTLGSTSKAESIIKSYVDIATNITSNIKNKCSAISNQVAEINLVTGEGKISIKKAIKQNSELFNDCVSKAIVNQNTDTEFQRTIDQSSTATNEGINPFAFIPFLIMLIGLIILTPLLIGASAISLLLKFFFPILFMIGIILLILFYVLQSEEMNLVEFTEQIGKQGNCRPTVLRTAHTLGPGGLEGEAGDICDNDSDCVAFDYVPIKNPNTTFYSAVEDTEKCFESIQADPKKVNENIPVKSPIVIVGSGPPSNELGAEKDIYIDGADGENKGKIYEKEITTWTSSTKGNLFNEINATPDEKLYPIRNIQGGLCDFSPLGGEKFFLVQYGTANGFPLTSPLPVYLVDRGDEICQIRGYIVTEGARAVPPPATSASWSGIKITTINWNLLAFGILFIVIGILGTILVFFTGKKK